MQVSDQIHAPSGLTVIQVSMGPQLSGPEGTRTSAVRLSFMTELDGSYPRLLITPTVSSNIRQLWFIKLVSGAVRSKAARILGSRVRIPLRAWIFVFCVYCLGSGLGDELITRSVTPTVCVCVCVRVWSRNLVKQSRSDLGCSATGKFINAHKTKHLALLQNCYLPMFCRMMYSVFQNECPNFKTLYFCNHEPQMNETAVA
jgi:hypothetical protein